MPVSWDSRSYLVIRVDPGRVGRLPQDQQGGLVPEPDDEPARRVWLGREVGRDVGGALLVLVDGVQLDFIGGPGGQVSQLERRAVLPDHDVADGLLGLRQRDHLQLEARVATWIWLRQIEKRR